MPPPFSSVVVTLVNAFYLYTFLLVAPATCSPSHQVTFAQHDSPSDRSISESLFVELEELSRIVDIAYCVGEMGVGVWKPFECPKLCAEFPNFELITTWNTGPMMSDSCGYIALSHAPSVPRIIIAFRGTYSIANTIADLSSMPQEYTPYPGEEKVGYPSGPRCINCTVHTGFYTSWLRTRTEIFPHIFQALKAYPDYSITLVGHSLGGAVAAFAALEMLARGLKPTVTTFGEPKIGNRALANYIDVRFNLTSNQTSDYNNGNFRRVTHRLDPVPLLPLDEWGYQPHGGEIYMSNENNPPELSDVYHCEGDADPHCIAGPEEGGGWTLPARFRLWELFFAHRDYFHRVGLCLPDGAYLWNSRQSRISLS